MRWLKILDWISIFLIAAAITIFAVSLTWTLFFEQDHVWLYAIAGICSVSALGLVAFTGGVRELYDLD